VAKKPSLHNADKWFSIYIRLRDADQNGYIICCSCGKRVFWRDADAGHFIGRKIRATRYDERNVHAQDRYCNRFCNRFLDGNSAGYARFLIAKYGVKILETLDLDSRRTTRWTPAEINEMADDFKARAIKLSKEKGLKI